MTEDELKAIEARATDLVQGVHDDLEHAVRADVLALLAEVRRLRAETSEGGAIWERLRDVKRRAKLAQDRATMYEEGSPERALWEAHAESLYDAFTYACGGKVEWADDNGVREAARAVERALLEGVPYSSD